MKDTSMGSRTKQRVDKSMIDEMTLSAYSNMVLLKIPDFEKYLIFLKVVSFFS